MTPGWTDEVVQAPEAVKWVSVWDLSVRITPAGKSGVICLDILIHRWDFIAFAKVVIVASALVKSKE